MEWGMGLPSSLEHPISLALPLSLLSVVSGAPPGPGPGLVLTSATPAACSLIPCGTRWAAGPEDLGVTTHTLSPEWLLPWAVQGDGGAFSRAGWGSRWGSLTLAGTSLEGAVPCVASEGSGSALGGHQPACAPGGLPGGHTSPLNYLRISDALSLSGEQGVAAAALIPHPARPGHWVGLPEPPHGLPGDPQGPPFVRGRAPACLWLLPLLCALLSSSPAGPLPSLVLVTATPTPSTGTARGTTASTPCQGGPAPSCPVGWVPVPGFASHLPCGLPPPPSFLQAALRTQTWGQV